MKKVIVLGSGLVGKVIASDLSKQYDVTLADINAQMLSAIAKLEDIRTAVCDFTNKTDLKNLLSPFDLVVGAVPGFMGYDVLKTAIECGKNVVDISFFPEDSLELDELAKQNNVTVVVDCGVAPGMCNLIAGYHHARMQMESYECLVGGLPQKREWPFEYKAVFSPIDVLEEYTRPARYVENGQIIIREALTDIEKINFDEVGTLESFNTDGLRTLMFTLTGVANMKEKTLRYPGHATLMSIFREAGMFSKERIIVNGKDIAPIDVTAKLLFPKWKMKEGDEDFTVMRVSVSGMENGHIVTHVYNLHDRFDSENMITSMARTTGFTCAAAVNLVITEQYNRIGISPPEFVGADEKCFNSVLSYLEARNVVYKRETITHKYSITV